MRYDIAGYLLACFMILAAFITAIIKQGEIIEPPVVNNFNMSDSSYSVTSRVFMPGDKVVFIRQPMDNNGFKIDINKEYLVIKSQFLVEKSTSGSFVRLEGLPMMYWNANILKFSEKE